MSFAILIPFINGRFRELKVLAVLPESEVHLEKDILDQKLGFVIFV